jgi:hypothetical protein
MGLEASDHVGKLSLLDGGYDGVDIFVGIGHLFGDGALRGGEYGDALGSHVFDDIAAAPCCHRFDAAARTPCAMAAATPCEGIAEADHEMACPAHVPGNKHRLSGFAEQGRKLFGSRTKCACCAFAVDAQTAWVTIDDVCFEFGDVVAHVIHEANLFRRDTEDLMECGAHFMQNLLAIVEGEVGSGCHGPEIILSRLALDGCGDELPIGKVFVVSLPDKCVQCILTHLVAKSA